jgi:hypothetical protein
MRKVRVFLLVYLLFGLSMAVSAYVIDIYPLEIAAGYLSRAMSAGNADDMVSYITQAYRLIPHAWKPCLDTANPPDGLQPNTGRYRVNPRQTFNHLQNSARHGCIRPDT